MDAERAHRLRARLVARAAADVAAAREGGAASARAADDAHAPPAAPATPGGTPVVHPFADARRPGDLDVRRGDARRPARLAPFRERIPWLAAAASLILAAALGAALWRADADRDTLARRLAASRGDVREARALLASRDSALASLTGPAVRTVTLTAAGPRAPSARMFWDQATHRWTFVARDLAPPRDGRTYQLWLVTTDRRTISAGTFEPGEQGTALVQATYELPRQALAAVAVTDEPDGGSTGPTTEPFLAGEAQR
jgi:anti-sigma-K factor RskA